MAASIKKNLPFFKQEFQVAVGESSVVVKFIGAAILLSYVLTFAPGVVDAITLRAGHPFAIWTFFTHSFVQIRIWHVLIDIAVCVLCGKLIEPLWGALGLALFYFLVNILVAFFTMITIMFVYMVTKEEDLLFRVHIHGLAGYIAGFTVAVKQMMPDNVLLNAPFGKVRNKHIPLLLLITTICGALSGALEGPYPIMFFWGIIISWTYLRFYQRHGNGRVGDLSDGFTFASFFPSAIEPFVAVICNTIFNFFVSFKICKKPERRYDVSSPTTITVTLPGTEPRDAERRRQLAIKALNDRLTKSDSQSNWPEMEESPSSSPTKESSPETLQEVKVEGQDTTTVQSSPKLNSSGDHEQNSSKKTKSLPVPSFKQNTTETVPEFKQSKDSSTKTETENADVPT